MSNQNTRIEIFVSRLQLLGLDASLIVPVSDLLRDFRDDIINQLTRDPKTDLKLIDTAAWLNASPDAPAIPVKTYRLPRPSLLDWDWDKLCCFQIRHRNYGPVTEFNNENDLRKFLQDLSKNDYALMEHSTGVILEMLGYTLLGARPKDTNPARWITVVDQDGVKTPYTFNSDGYCLLDGPYGFLSPNDFQEVEVIGEELFKPVAVPAKEVK